MFYAILYFFLRLVFVILLVYQIIVIELIESDVLHKSDMNCLGNHVEFACYCN